MRKIRDSDLYKEYQSFFENRIKELIKEYEADPDSNYSEMQKLCLDFESEIKKKFKENGLVNFLGEDDYEINDKIRFFCHKSRMKPFIGEKGVYMIEINYGPLGARDYNLEFRNRK